MEFLINGLKPVIDGKSSRINRGLLLTELEAKTEEANHPCTCTDGRRFAARGRYRGRCARHYNTMGAIAEVQEAVGEKVAACGSRDTTRHFIGVRFVSPLCESNHFHEFRRTLSI